MGGKTYMVDERVNKRSTRQAIRSKKKKHEHELQHGLGTIIDYQHKHNLQNNIFYKEKTSAPEPEESYFSRTSLVLPFGSWHHTCNYSSTDRSCCTMAIWILFMTRGRLFFLSCTLYTPALRRSRVCA
jgi:hypothetical protein